MKIKSHKKFKKKKLYVAVIIGVILAVLLFITWFTYHYQLWPFQASGQKSLELQNNSDSTNNQTKVQSVKKDINVDKSKTTTEIPVLTDTTVSITQLSQDSSNVTYSATIANPGKTGTCSAIFTNPDGKPVVLPETPATGNKCGPSSASNAEFSVLGVWTLTLRYYTNNSQAIATQTIDIK